MPSMTSHKVAAENNQRTLRFLLQRSHDHSPWVVTVAFYTALHIVEAVFAYDGFHTDEHGARNTVLKRTRRYQHLWKNYAPLYNDSLIARYIHNDSSPAEYSQFSDYMSPEEVVAKHIRHHLVQVAASARSLTGDDTILR